MIGELKLNKVYLDLLIIYF